MDTIIIAIVALTIQCFIFYIIIKSATKSEQKDLQNKEIIKLLRLIARGNGANAADIYNASPANVVKVKMSEAEEESRVTVKARTNDMLSEYSTFSKDVQQKINKAKSNGDEYVTLSVAIEAL